MTDITLFATTKPFDGHNGIIQRNALRSWARLRAAPKIVLFGNESGTAEAAQEIGAKHVADIRCNTRGTPLISDMFARAQDISVTELYCYLNADIILFDHFADALTRVSQRFSNFVMIGRRVDLDVTESLAFDADWSTSLREQAHEAGQLSAATALDYFAYRRGVFDHIPDFAVGRPAWDAWMVMDTRRRGLPLVDVTSAVTVVHQNHGYGHVQNASGAAWEGPEADQNRILARRSKPDFMPHLYNVHCANWRLQEQKILPAWSAEHLHARARLLWYDLGGQNAARIARIVLRPANAFAGPNADTSMPRLRRAFVLYQKVLESAWVVGVLTLRRPLMLTRCITKPKRLRKLIRRCIRVLSARKK